MSKQTVSSKTPYEIRLELLQMAKDHLDATFKMQFDFATRMANALIEQNRATVEEIQKLMPKAYSIEDITKRAAELYGFILKKD